MGDIKMKYNIYPKSSLTAKIQQSDNINTHPSNKYHQFTPASAVHACMWTPVW